MRKEYTKPVCYAESYELMESISTGGNCTTLDAALTTHRTAESGCGYFLDKEERFSGVVLFNSGVRDCNASPADFELTPNSEVGDYNGIQATLSTIFAS